MNLLYINQVTLQTDSSVVTQKISHVILPVWAIPLSESVAVHLIDQDVPVLIDAAA